MPPKQPAPVNPFADLIGEVKKDSGGGNGGGKSRWSDDLVNAIADKIEAGGGRGEDNMLAIAGHTDGFNAKTVGTAGYQLKDRVNAVLLARNPDRPTVLDRRQDPSPVPCWPDESPEDGHPIVVRQGKATDKEGYTGHIAGVWVGPQHGWTAEKPSED